MLGAGVPIRFAGEYPNRCAKLRGAWPRGDFQVALFTTAVQIEHLVRVAEE